MRRLFLVLAVGMVMAGCARKPPAPARQSKPAARPPAPHVAAEVERDAVPELPAPEAPTNLRPVLVTVNEYSAPAAGARVVIEHYDTSSRWWSAHCNAEGQATIPMPIELTRFRVSAMQPPYAIVSSNLFNLPVNNAPVPVTLVLSQTGVVITAQITAPRPALLSNLTIRIQPANNADWQHVSVARIEDVAGATQVLPPIKTGLVGLRVAVTAPRCALSLSEPFHTRDGKDKTVPVTLLEGVVVRGRALREDGTPVVSFRMDGEPTEAYDLPRGAGAVHETLTTSADGSFACGTFLPNFYRLYASCDQAQAIATNLLVDVEGAWLDLTFRPQRFRTIRGKVLIERTQQPVPQAVVWWERTARSATTDVAGAFSLRVPESQCFYSRLSVAHEGYAAAQRYVQNSCLGQEIVLLLRDAGHVAGTVHDEAGAPVSGVYVHISGAEPSRYSRASVAFGSEDEAWEEQQTFQYVTARPSDGEGNYVISNTAAPKSYCVDMYGQHYRLVRPSPRAAAFSTRVGAVSRCDLTVRGMPVVLVKFLDEQRVPVQTYQLHVESRSDTGEGSSSMRVQMDTTDPDGWYCLSDWCARGTGVVLAVHATSQDITAGTNDVRITAAGTNFITLVAGGTNSPGLCGYLYDCDDEPLVDVWVYGHQQGMNRSLGNARTDHLGFFEFTGGSTATGMVQLFTHVRDASYSTNMPMSTTPIVWRLPPARAVRGRVCLEHADAPVTNFVIGLNPWNKRAFSADDGRFSMAVDNDSATAGVVYAWVEDYAPGQKEFCLDAQGQCDVGDIIVSATACALRGRVVNERTQPLSAQVSLTSAGDRPLDANARSDAENGRYEFTRMPTGTYQVSAWKNGAMSGARSEWIALNGSGVVDVPDLVLHMTNAALVRLVFVMPDGTPAAGMQVSAMDATTDAQGAVEDYLRLGPHKNVCLYAENQRYYAEPFVIEAGTRELRVTLLPLDTIAGTVTLDGQPMPEGNLSLRNQQGRDFSCMVRNGAFTLQAMPGTYLAVSYQKKAFGTVTLAAGDQNTIAFVSGTAALNLTFPFAARWSAGLEIDVDGVRAHIGQGGEQDTTALELDALPAGDYTLRCYGYMGNSYTNIETKVTLTPGARATLNFQ